MMEDVQNQLDERGIAIDQVGVSDVRYPIVVLDRAHQRQQTVARLAISVNLPHYFKGTHMSRFIEVLNAHRGEVTMRTLPAMLCDLKRRLHAESALCSPSPRPRVTQLMAHAAGDLASEHCHSVMSAVAFDTGSEANS